MPYENKKYPRLEPSRHFENQNIPNIPLVSVFKLCAPPQLLACSFALLSPVNVSASVDNLVLSDVRVFLLSDRLLLTLVFPLWNARKLLTTLLNKPYFWVPLSD